MLFIMKILSWNAGGLGRSSKRNRFRNLMEQQNIDMVFLQETKTTVVTERFVRSLWKHNHLSMLKMTQMGELEV